ncbi:hypothetical protein QAD02_003465 [Eretmocerus hayati]|uniref:Uncharacterized protein n=1 Tax=Eretmocerus hayati TaxID=131215 RepID=A0ACC2NNM8_9HYME|nr:hypothetical protein QAD02_003465 [Eretmocerus hayati]
MICNLLITHDINGTREFRIVKERFEEWTEEIADTLIVPGKTRAQVKAIFYHAFKKATKTKKSVNTGGSVYEKYLNERKWLTSRGIITKAQVLSEGNLSRDGLANIQGAPEIFVFVTINAIDFVVESNSLLDGFNYCYQSFSALGIPYTGECNLVWVFLQRRIYKNNLEDIRDLYRSVDKFIETLDQKRS